MAHATAHPDIPTVPSSSVCPPSNRFDELEDRRLGQDAFVGHHWVMYAVLVPGCVILASITESAR